MGACGCCSGVVQRQLGEGAHSLGRLIAAPASPSRNIPDTSACAAGGRIRPMTPSAIALNRFGLGARPDEPPPADPQRWLLAQLDAYDSLPAAWKPLRRTTALVDVWHSMQRS